MMSIRQSNSRAKKSRQPSKKKNIINSSPQTVKNEVDVSLENTEQQIKYRLRPWVKHFGSVLIILGILFLVSGLLDIYKEYQAQKPEDKGNVLVEQVEETEENNDTEQTKISSINTKRVNAATTSAEAKADRSAKQIKTTGRWRATDYQKGDIGIGSYKVKLGDTLWEISEAVYGSGFKWKKILRRNKQKVGFLANGSQALIRPGQVLVIGK